METAVPPQEGLFWEKLSRLPTHDAIQRSKRPRRGDAVFFHPSTATLAGYRNETLTQAEAKCPPTISCWVDPDQLSACSQASTSLRHLLSGIPHVSPESSRA